MEINEIAQLVSTLGFPIVCCVFMWRHINTTQKEITNAVNRNTTVMEKLLTRLEMEDVHKNEGV